MADTTHSTVNIPQIIVVAVVGFLAIRWYMSKPAGSAQDPRPARSRQVDPAKVEQVAAMFPQLDRRTIAWDLQRNGQNVQATIERVLMGQGLENPPPSFQPPNLAPPTQQAPAVGVSASGSKPPGAAQQDLITRYNLQSRVGGKGKEAVPSEEQQKQQAKSAWSSDKSARAEGLRKRREEMVLAARRKMEEKEAASGKAS